MGLSGGTKTKTTSHETATTTPEMPGWASSAIEDYFSGVGDLGKSDPYSFVTPATDLQKQGFEAAGNLPNGAGYGQAADATRASLFGTVPTVKANMLGEGTSVLDNFSDYLDPTTDYLRDQSIATFDDSAARQKAALESEAAKNGAFGDSRYGIQMAQQAADTSRDRGLLDASLLSDAWTKAAGLSQFDITTQQQRDLADQAAALEASKVNASNAITNRGLDLGAAGQLADITGAESENARANLGSLFDAGNLEYALEDAKTQAPLTLQEKYASLFNPSLIGLLTGQTIVSDGNSTSKQSGGLLNSLLAAGSQVGSAALLASERRVKRNIELLGREDDGLGVYHYNYVWDAPDEPARAGVMADEVAAIRPWALGPIVDGIQTVNYGEL